MVKFNEETHTYTNDGKTLVSVTQLLSLAKISPSFDCVDEIVLQKAIDRGNRVHKEIENWIKLGEKGDTEELSSFIQYIQEHKIKPVYSEQRIWDDVLGGTIDMVAEDQNGDLMIVDFKTTSTLHTDSVQWQLSIYKYLFEKITDLDVKKIQAFHFSKDGSLDVKEFPTINKEQIEGLIKWYEEMSISDEFVPYEAYLPSITDNDIQALTDAEQVIANMKKKLEEAQANADKVRQTILDSMKKCGLTHFKNDQVSIAIIPQSESMVFDSTRFQKENPQVVEQYLKKSVRKESVRITIKKGKE